MTVFKNKMILLLVYMDEKYFLQLKRTPQKIITSEGFLPKDFNVHRKSHMGKHIYTVVVAFFPKNYDITQGLYSVMVSCVCVGKMVNATTDPYK